MMAQKANEEIAKNPENSDFYRAKVRAAEFYVERIFPRIKILGKDNNGKSQFADADDP